MIVYNKTDIMLSDDGDLLFDNGDFVMCNGAETFAQHVKMYCLTNKEEIPLHPNIGANLYEFIGSPNTRDTGDMLTIAINDSLESYGVFDISEITIRSIPTDYNEITANIYVDILHNGVIERVFVNVPVLL